MTNLATRASDFLVYVSRHSGSPPAYSSWQFLFDAAVESIEKNDFSTPSKCVVVFPKARWNDDIGVTKGDRIRVVADGIIMFEGFVTAFQNSFTGGSQRGDAWERLAAVAHSYTWLLSHCPVWAQAGRTQDNYTGYGTSNQSPVPGAYTWFTGRRCIFNEDGKPNRAPLTVTVEGEAVCLFGDKGQGMLYFSARDMISNLCLYANKTVLQLFSPLKSLDQLTGTEWDAQLGNVCCEGLSLAEAMEYIFRQVGWMFREDWFYSGPQLTFKQVGDCTIHSLYAPAPGEDIRAAVLGGEKMLWAMDVCEDISQLINNPVVIGSPHRVEITAELKPAWKPADLVPDTANSNEQLFYSDDDLDPKDDPNQYSFFKYYHTQGSQFKHEVGRLWVLNENGRWTGGAYDLGLPFDFTTIVEPAYSKNGDGTRSFGPFSRCFFNCLSSYENTNQSLGIKVELSFDAGLTWQVVDGVFEPSKEQCGVLIKESNLSHIKSLSEQKEEISEGVLAGVELNYWTSICDDKLNTRSFKDNQWHTRVRVTASVQLDQRLVEFLSPSNISGSPLMQSKLFDFSDKYGLHKKSSSSKSGGTVFDIDLDQTDKLKDHAAKIHAANQDASVAGRFTLDRLYLSNGGGYPVFNVGDSIDYIAGRNYSLQANSGQGSIYPEIVQILYLPQMQKMALITRDLRFSESRQ